jgi:hypothetical protein
MPEEERGDEGGEQQPQPKRQKVSDVPLGIRRPRAPALDATSEQDRQHDRDDERDHAIERSVSQQPLEAPDKHRDYEIREGDDHYKHLENICSHNALLEMIVRAREEVEHELNARARPFRGTRLDEMVVFAREAVMSLGECEGYEALKAHVKEIIYNEVLQAREEMDRKKDAYMRLTGK